MIRKAKAGELPSIIDTANRAFRPVRYDTFDFTNRMSKIYHSRFDYAPIHWVDEENGTIVSTAGNFIGHIQGCKYSFIGTVATLPAYQHQGHMTRLIQAVDDWNRQNGVVFSVLTGERQRYNYFGFEKSAFQNLYTVTRKYCERNIRDEGITIAQSNAGEAAALYRFYRQTQCVQVRDEACFYEYINNYSTPYTVYQGNKILGYFIIKNNKTLITEIALLSPDLLPATLRALFKIIPDNRLELQINPLNRDICQQIERICETKCCQEELHFKVYDCITFLHMLFTLNSKIRHFADCQEVYSVDDVTLQLTVSNGELFITQSTATPLMQFTLPQFVRYVMDSHSFLYSRIFPLFFDFNDVDAF